MYCPQCKAEYRQGFTRCADCEVELVHEPPPAAHGFGTAGETGSHGEDSDDPFCSFWRGDDPRIHAELCELLNEEGIPHKTVRREDHLFNLNSKSGFQIGIPFSQFEKAEAAIKDAYGTEEEEQDPARLLAYGGVMPQNSVTLSPGSLRQKVTPGPTTAKTTSPRVWRHRLLKNLEWTSKPKTAGRVMIPRTGIRKTPRAKCGMASSFILER